MALQDKYASVIAAAQNNGAANLQVREQDNILYLDAEVPTGEAKDKIWDAYGQADPDFRSADMVLNINVSPAAPSTLLKVNTESSNLNIRKGPGLDQTIIGKAAHHSHVTLLSYYNDEWALIRSEKGEEGYCSRKYLATV